MTFHKNSCSEGCRQTKRHSDIKITTGKKMSSKINITFEEFNKNANEFIEISNKLNDSWNYILNVSLISKNL